MFCQFVLALEHRILMRIVWRRRDLTMKAISSNGAASESFFWQCFVVVLDLLAALIVLIEFM